MGQKSKFNVDYDKTKRTYDGIIFDSVLEMNYYKEQILPLVESGDIVHFELQKQYELQPEFKHDGRKVQSIRYVADFYIVYANEYEEVIDIKGQPDSVALLKRKMFWYNYPNVDYKWISYSKMDSGWIEYEKLKKLRAQRKKGKEYKKGAKK